MIILGLGSNVGDKLENLRTAYHHLQSLANLKVKQVSPLYFSDALLPENAPADWNIPHLNCALRCETTLEPMELLSAIKHIEMNMGRTGIVKKWSPRIIDIDILAWGDLVMETNLITIPHAGLLERPFALWPLADVAPEWLYPVPGDHYQKCAAELIEIWGSRFKSAAPLKTQQINHRIDTPKIVGIINVTPDSFSDGGKYFKVDHALQHAQELVMAGADVLDIGAESTAPRASPLTPFDEWARLEPVLTAIQGIKFFLPTPISVDTRYPETAMKAINLGVNIINDVTGFGNPAMRKTVANSNYKCIVMHHLGLPPTNRHVLPRDKDPIDLLYAWAVEQIKIMQDSGINKDRLILDPGIGFGKTPEQSLAIIKNIARLTTLDVKWLIGHSRKSFLVQFTALQFAERDIETLTLTLHLAKQPVDYIRVHNVEMTARALKVAASVHL